MGENALSSKYAAEFYQEVPTE
ncbi:hypothetical protein BOS5A_211302 [Bosea sp. EC-HK365B]|nr:hypothetical protein BOSE7B_90302 [Bosea sp. 7B]VVT60511.1 hypothetical protein BOS5A_211302 [Bosea sp. EC-HK365B]